MGKDGVLVYQKPPSKTGNHKRKGESPGKREETDRVREVRESPEESWPKKESTMLQKKGRRPHFEVYLARGSEKRRNKGCNGENKRQRSGERKGGGVVRRENGKERNASH